jgi:xylan 1,4-beta-xylosidase
MKQYSPILVQVALLVMLLAAVRAAGAPPAKPNVIFILAVDNGDATSLEPFQTNQVKVYNGLCLAIVRAKPGKAGNINLQAMSEGLSPATIVIRSRLHPAQVAASRLVTRSAAAIPVLSPMVASDVITNEVTSAFKTNWPVLPPIKALFDYPIRDTCVCLGPDGTYYLTGTTGSPGWWKTNEGVRIWKSPDLKTWQPIGLVWSFGKNTTWQKTFEVEGVTTPDKKRGRLALWAPELHYFKGTFWIAYCVVREAYNGTGILKSTTNKPEGPYVDIKTDGPLTHEIDASLFIDDDGKVYFVYQNGKIARMKDDMSGLAEQPRLLHTKEGSQVGFEGAFVFKANGRYHLLCADFTNDRQYHCMAASSEKLEGPYGSRYLAIPHGGHNMVFQDRAGQFWSTMFGNSGTSPIREKPAILKIGIGMHGRIQPLVDLK